MRDWKKLKAYQNIKLILTGVNDQIDNCSRNMF